MWDCRTLTAHSSLNCTYGNKKCFLEVSTWSSSALSSHIVLFGFTIGRVIYLCSSNCILHPPAPARSLSETESSGSWITFSLKRRNMKIGSIYLPQSSSKRNKLCWRENKQIMFVLAQYFFNNNPNDQTCKDQILLHNNMDLKGLILLQVCIVINYTAKNSW